MSGIAPGRLDQLVMACTRAALDHCAGNLGLSKEHVDTAWPSLQPTVQRLIDEHVTGQPITLDSVLENMGALKPREKPSVSR